MVKSYINDVRKFSVQWLIVAILLYLVLAVMLCLIWLSLAGINPLNWSASARGCVVVGSFLITLVIQEGRQ